MALYLCETPGLTPRMNMVDTGILFSNMKYPSHECLMTFWPLTNSDLTTDKTFHKFHGLDTELDQDRIMSGFIGAFATDVAIQQGTLTLFGHLVPSPFLKLACAPIVETRFLELAMSLLDVSPWIPLGTFSIFFSTFCVGTRVGGWLGTLKTNQ